GECIQMYFDLLAKGHTCEEAKLHFKQVKARFKCLKCGHEFDHDKDFSCPECGGDARLIPGTGKEFMIGSLDYETGS
nr:hydrogenase maturation nickel metallochaperone HypA [Lachnospiraceae bacterium]